MHSFAALLVAMLMVFGYVLVLKKVILPWFGIPVRLVQARAAAFQHLTRTKFVIVVGILGFGVFFAVLDVMPDYLAWRIWSDPLPRTAALNLHNTLRWLLEGAFLGG